MKTAIIVLVFFAVLVVGIVSKTYIDRDKEHIYTPAEVFSIECSKSGRNPSTRSGWEGQVRVEEYKCEGVENVRN